MGTHTVPKTDPAIRGWIEAPLYFNNNEVSAGSSNDNPTPYIAGENGFNSSKTKHEMEKPEMT